MAKHDSTQDIKATGDKADKLAEALRANLRRRKSTANTDKKRKSETK